MANAPFDPFGDRKDDDDLGDLAQNIIHELKNASDIVLDAAQASKDEILKAVGEGVRSARNAAREAQDSVRRSATEARAQYSSDFKAAQQDFAAQRQARQQAAAQAQKKQKNRFRPISKNANYLLIPVAMLYTPAGILLLLSSARLLFGQALSPEIPVIASSFLCIGAAPLGIFLGRKRKEKLYTRYLRTIGEHPSVNLRFLAAQMKRSESKCVEDLRDMLSRGYFPENARLDLSRGELIVDEAAANARKAQQEEQQRAAAAEANKSESDSYEAMLTELQQLNVLIEGKEMSELITRIETVARATFLAVRQTPEKAPQLRRFMDYYLPTTIKLLRSYALFERSSVEGDNIRKSKENIEAMMKTLCEAFEKQYDSLFLTETMDINAEIKTMDSLLRQDGFVGGANFGSSAQVKKQ